MTGQHVRQAVEAEARALTVVTAGTFTGELACALCGLSSLMLLSFALTVAGVVAGMLSALEVGR